MNAEQLKTISDDELSDVAWVSIAAQRDFAPMAVQLDFLSAWQVIGLLQLALKHPGITGSRVAETGRELVEGLIERVATTPELQEFARRGWGKSS